MGHDAVGEVATCKIAHHLFMVVTPPMDWLSCRVTQVSGARESLRSSPGGAPADYR